MADFKVKLDVDVDVSKIQSKLGNLKINNLKVNDGIANKIQSRLNNAKFTLNNIELGQGFVNGIQQQLNGFKINSNPIVQQTSKIGTKVGQAISDSVQKATTSLNSKPIDVLKEQTSLKIEGLIADMQKAGITSQELTADISKMNAALGASVDVSGIKNVLNNYDIARTKLQTLKKEASTKTTKEALSIGKDSLFGSIDKVVSNNANLQTFKTNINGVETSVASLKTELAAVQNSGDMSVVTKKWEAFVGVAKEAGVVCENTANITKQLSAYTTQYQQGKYSANANVMQASVGKYSDYNTQNLQNARTALEQYKKDLESIQNHFSGQSPLADNNLLATFNSLTASANTFTNSMKSAQIEVANLVNMQNQSKLISSKIEDKTYESQISSLQAKLKTYHADNSAEYTQAAQSVKDLTTAYERLRTARDAYNSSSTTDNYNAMISAQENLVSSMRRTENEMKILENVQDKVVSSGAKASAEKSFASYWKNNTQALKAYREQYEALKTSLANVSTEGEFATWKEQFTQLQARAINEGNTGISWTDNIKRGFNKIGQFVGTYWIQMKAIQAVKDMISNVIQIDTAMTQLKRVTDETDESYNKFLTSAANNAEKLGTSVSSLVTQTATWAKLG